MIRWIRQKLRRDLQVLPNGNAVIPGAGELTHVHPESACKGRVCVVHDPTRHHMRSWPLHWRSDRGMFERICEHGTGHPDPDQKPFWESAGLEWMDVHGCCGCCFKGER